MKYALNIGADGRILSATYEEFACKGMQIVDKLPDGDISDYCYVNNEFVFNPIIAPAYEPTVQDDMDAMLIDHEYRLTILELGLV